MWNSAATGKLEHDTIDAIVMQCALLMHGAPLMRRGALMHGTIRLAFVLIVWSDMRLPHPAGSAGWGVTVACRVAGLGVSRGSMPHATVV